jgi:hypothetical protein
MQPGGPARQPYSYSVPIAPHILFKNSSTDHQLISVYMFNDDSSASFLLGYLLLALLLHHTIPHVEEQI